MTLPHTLVSDMRTMRLCTAVILASACSPPPMARGTVLRPADVPTIPAHRQPSPEYWPTIAWRHAEPESQGLRSDVLADAIARLRAAGTPIHSLFIVRNGYVVLDATFYPFRRDERHDLASVTKSITSLLTGSLVARHPGLADARVDSLLLGKPGTESPRVEDLLGMRSGFDCGFGRSERELEAMKRTHDWVAFALSLPRRSSPGSEFGYCSPNYQLLSAVISRVTGESEAEFARHALFEPMGIRSAYWPADPLGRSHGWGDLQMLPEDLARIGLLLLHHGNWNGRQLVPEAWIEQTTLPRVGYGQNDLYGLGWWTHRSSPAGFFEGIGRGGQRLSVWPGKNLVVVITGGGFEPAVIGEMLSRAIAADSTLPPNAQAVAALRSAVEGALQPSVTPNANASAISGAWLNDQDILLGQNSLGLRRIALAFSDTAPSTAMATLELADRVLVLEVGLDGRYRRSGTPVDSVVPAARATWRTARELVFELDLVGKIDHYTLDIPFESDASIDIRERTGLLHEVIPARLVRPSHTTSDHGTVR